jgi:hypothetical protein
MEKIEIWKDVKGYEGYYQISDFGNIRSLDRYVNTTYGKRIEKGKILKKPISHGYCRIALQKNGFIRKIMIHRLVSLAFIENIENKEQVNHINGIKNDNRVENLEWVTQSENELHSYRILNKKSLQGQLHGNSKLTEKDVLEIRQSELSDKELSLIYNSSRKNINDIKNKKRWKHI